MNKKTMLIYLGLFVALLNLFDGFATNYGMTNNFIEELNPLMDALMTTPILFLSLKTALSILILFVTYLVSKHCVASFQKLFLSSLICVSFIYTGIFGLHLIWLFSL